ncbi:SixA phosphatase family protein [Rickettsia endosymbiont of Cardiosporidium cionae]|uniref:SixA phosphatase family protein n=1 Tax=Rickettsia endosymbiont of Cardiosporidium cionae TaxID=2777155 RepID=UPI001892E3B2|nr:histidine phosphatase family protein [Rickettsia endosymbiont of Cardiosporidium cionae]KAF8818919.1 hypothetical protein IHI24_000153 [Rickettsia endosymbiont of Cardiosporidium cionae]
MKLFLMRHADAKCLDNNKADSERILTKNGVLEATQAGNFLKNYSLDKILVSYITRALQTYSVITYVTGDINTEIVKSLYSNDLKNIVELIKKQNDKNKHILIIGHNPSIHYFVQILSDKYSKYYSILNTMMPNSRIVAVNLFIDSWVDFSLEVKREIITVFTPKVQKCT